MNSQRSISGQSLEISLRTSALWLACLFSALLLAQPHAIAESSAANSSGKRGAANHKAYNAAPLIAIPAPQKATALKENTQGEIWFDSKSPFDFDILLNHFDKATTTSTMAYLYLPDGASAKSPASAMVFLPGSGGIRLGRQMLYAEFLVSNGYAVAVVDYYGSRGVDINAVPYQTMVNNVTEFDIVTDAYSALNALQKHPAIDGDKIAVMGFSYGGMATRLAMDERIRKRIAKKGASFKAHADYYGPCFQQFNTPKTTGAPLLALRGAKDSSNDLVACVMREEELRALGSPVDAVTYATAGHAWEGLRPAVMGTHPHIRGCTLEYDERGLPSVRGKQLIQEGTDMARKTRHRLRAESGAHFRECLQMGYLVGRHNEAHRESQRELLRFLGKHL